MGRYRIKRRIEAPPERVFRAFTDPAILADWMDASGVINVSGLLETLGSRYTLVIRGPWRFRVEVVAAEPPLVHETVYHGPLGTVVRRVGTISPLDGASDLDLLTEYTMPLGPIGRWIDRRWIDREPHATANRVLDRLVALVTGGASTASVPAPAWPSARPSLNDRR